MNRRKISDIANTGRVVQLSAEASVRDASRLMAREKVGAVLVTDNGRLEGIFTERDALGRVLAKQLDPEATRLEEVMSADPTTISPDASAIDALRLMRDGGFRHLPIVADGALLGVVSLRDFFGAELSQVEREQAFQTAFAEGSTSEAIARADGKA